MLYFSNKSDKLFFLLIIMNVVVQCCIKTFKCCKINCCTNKLKSSMDMVNFTDNCCTNDKSEN